MSRYVYMLFLVPVTDYFRTLNKKEFVFLIILPLIITVILSVYFIYGIGEKDNFQNLDIYINLLAILIGFSITGLAILASGGSKNLDLLRLKLSKSKKLDGKPVDLYKLLLINFTYVVIVELFTLSLNLLFSIFYTSEIFIKLFNVFFFVNSFLFLHIIFQNIKNVTNIYFSLFREL